MDILTELWAAAQQAGPFASLLLLAAWWFERAERRELQGQYNALVERLHVGLNGAATSINDLRNFLLNAAHRDGRRRE